MATTGAAGKERARNMRLLGHHDLDGFGRCGEGIALQALPDGRRILYIAHETGPKDFSVVDVSDVADPRLPLQTELPSDGLRSNSLALTGDMLLVACQTSVFGARHAGMRVFDVSDPSQPRLLSYFDTSGPHSRGVHCLWFVDGRYAHLATGAADFEPLDRRDDRFYMIVDVADPEHPQEAGRWWLPGIRKGDVEPPPERHTTIDSGFRVHNANVYSERPDRAYVGYLDGGSIILDISDLSRPRQVSRVDHHPPFNGFTHTVLPLFDRGLLVVTDEATGNALADWPKLAWVMDARTEENPVILSTLPLPPAEEFRQEGLRFGAHNIHENQPVPTSWRSDRYVVGTYFNGGVRVHDISDPFRPEEVASYIPAVPDGAAGVQTNDVYVDENEVIYAVDRIGGGLYILALEL